MFVRPARPPAGPRTGTVRAPGRVASARAMRIAPMRIGLVSDTHDDLCDWPAVCGRVSEALAGVDLVVVCGDLSTLAVLDDLEAAVAPVRATRNTDDPAPIPGRLDDGPIVIDADGTAIGVSFSVPEPRVGADWKGFFGRPVDVVVFGGTHAPVIEHDGDILLVNPGSPSLAAELTVGELTVGDGVPALASSACPLSRRSLRPTSCGARAPAGARCRWR